MSSGHQLVAVELPGRGLLELAGLEARIFLQGLVSNDLDRLGPQAPLHAALLTPQGKYLFDFLLYEKPGGNVLLDTEAGRLDELERRLLMYRLRAQVDIQRPATSLAVAALWSSTDQARPEAPAAADRAIVVPDPRSPALGWRIVAPVGAMPAALAASGARLVDHLDYDRLRIALGVPDGSRDLVPQKSILLEANFDALNGVAFDKGCFVGQELTARTKHRGLIKKRLVPVRLEGPVPEPGTLIHRGEREAGELRSHAGDLGLALLRLEQLTPAPSSEPLRAGDAVLYPLPPPWLSGAEAGAA